MAILAKPIALGDEATLHAGGLYMKNLLAFGGPGAGKSNLLRLIYERAPVDFQRIIVDTEDEFATLRAPGREYVILGGPDADRPGLEKMDWRALGLVIVRLRANVIFQINEWRLTDQRQFISDLTQGMLQQPRTEWRPLIFGLDESDLYAPNGSQVESSEALLMLAKTGRKRGWSTLFATQKIALISAEVRAMCQNRAIGVANDSVDMRAAAEAIGVTARSEEAQGLKALTVGQFWLMGPAFGSPQAHLVQLARAESREPEPGAAPAVVVKPRKLEKALDALPMRPEPKLPEPAADAAETTREREIVTVVDESAVLAARTEGEAEGVRRGMAAAARRLRVLADKLDGIAGDVEAEAITTTTLEVVAIASADAARLAANLSKGHAADRPRANGHDVPAKPAPEGLSASHMKILEALGRAYSVGVTQPARVVVAKVAGYTASGGRFGNLLGALRTAGMVDYPTAETVRLTQAGLQTAPIPTSGTAAERMRLDASHLKVLKALPRGRPMDRAALAEQAGYEPSGGRFGNILGHLRTFGFVTYPDAATVQATALAFS